MLKESDIRSYSNTKSYMRGVDIYKSSKIRKFVVDESDIRIDYIEAHVKGSGINIYDVYGSYVKDEDYLNHIYCECPAFNKYDGLCKHCCAILLEYISYTKKRDNFPKIKSNLSDQTTPEIKELLANQITKKTLLITNDSTYGQVGLYPFIICDEDNIAVEFKIGVTQKYVLKDVFTFIGAVENYENINYGKKLKFIHSMDAFTPEYRPLVQFVYNWVQRNKQRYASVDYYGYFDEYTYPKLRVLPLSGFDLSEFLNAMGDSKILMNVDNTGDKEWSVTGEILPRRLSIRKNKKGIELSINHVSGYIGNSENIYFHDEKIYRIPHSEIEPIKGFLETMSKLDNRKVYIQKEDIPAFSRELLPSLEEHFDCDKGDFNESDYGVVPVTFNIYLDAPAKDYITGNIIAVYGDEKYNVINKNKGTNMRDLVNEMATLNIVSSYFNDFDRENELMVIDDDEDKLYDLLVSGISKMHEIAEVYVTDAFNRLKIVSAPRVEVGVAVRGDTMELRMTSEDMSEEQLIEILTKYNRKKKFYRLKNGSFINVVGEDLEALLELKQGLQLTNSQLKQENIEIPKYRALYLDSEFKERNSLSVTKDREFRALIRNMKTVEDNDFDIPESLNNTLREYQKRGFLWIKTLQHNGFGGILADDMGLGKTLQVICYLLSEHKAASNDDNTKTLIVCPASLVFNWFNEFNKFAPELPVRMVIGTAPERREIIQHLGNKDIIITSYDLLKRDIECYKDIKFRSEIIDEAQNIKNSNTQAAKAVKFINSGFKLALTGTPIENKLSELWSIFDYLMPGYLYSYQKFKQELEVPIVQNQDEVAMSRLQKMITPFILRRLKKDVLKDLPDKLEENIYASMEGEQKKLYNAHVQRLQMSLSEKSDEEYKRSKIQFLAELTKLRQICCDPSLLYDDYKGSSSKTQMCIDIINNAISGGHKILLFSQFTTMLDILKQKLEDEKIDYYMLTGSTSKENRAKMVEQFNQDDIPVFLISLKAGGTGLNLTAADIVIHYDPWWNTAVQNQATDRAHRIGQTNIVNVYRLIVKGTIEENIMKIQESKHELAEQVLSGEGISIGSFSKEDLLELLQ